MYISLIVISIGIVTGIALIVINVRTCHSLLGSFFRRSYTLATVGCLFFTLGFAVELFYFFGYDHVIFDIAHHVFLVLSIILFTLVGTNFPKEASEALAEKLEKKVPPSSF